MISGYLCIRDDFKGRKQKLYVQQRAVWTTSTTSPWLKQYWGLAQVRGSIAIDSTTCVARAYGLGHEGEAIFRKCSLLHMTHLRPSLCGRLPKQKSYLILVIWKRMHFLRMKSITVLWCLHSCFFVHFLVIFRNSELKAHARFYTCAWSSARCSQCVLYAVCFLLIAWPWDVHTPPGVSFKCMYLLTFLTF